MLWVLIVNIEIGYMKGIIKWHVIIIANFVPIYTMLNSYNHKKNNLFRYKFATNK